MGTNVAEGLSEERLAEAIRGARECVAYAGDPREIGYSDFNELADFWSRAIVTLAGRCQVGVPCARHKGVVHGQEAEELRKGLEEVLAGWDDEDSYRALVSLLERVDARDSLAFGEVKAS